MTWADILGSQFSEYQNWGQAGGGNKYIYHSLMEADQRHRFGSTDTVVVCWTNIMRDDRYVKERGWITLGNIATSPIFTKEFIADSVCERGYLLETLNLIKGAKETLQNRGCKWRFLSMVPIMQPDNNDDRKLDYNDITDVYQDVIDCILPSFTDILGHAFWERNKEKRHRYPNGGFDYHPTTEEALTYLDSVLPNWITNQPLRDKIKQEPIVWNKVANGACMQQRF